MLGIILLIFIATKFNQLAKKYGKTGWHYALASIGIYYGVTFLFAFIVGVFLQLDGVIMADRYVLAISLGGVAVSLVSLYALYGHLKKKWSMATLDVNSEVLDDELSRF
jgi:phosphate starvation-inducible membrane PsiE